MLDINYIKENPQEVIDRLAMKGKDANEDIAKILENRIIVLAKIRNINARYDFAVLIFAHTLYGHYLF